MGALNSRRPQHLSFLLLALSILVAVHDCRARSVRLDESATEGAVVGPEKSDDATSVSGASERSQVTSEVNEGGRRGWEADGPVKSAGGEEDAEGLAGEGVPSAGKRRFDDGTREVADESEVAEKVGLGIRRVEEDGSGRNEADKVYVEEIRLEETPRSSSGIIEEAAESVDAPVVRAIEPLTEEGQIKEEQRINAAGNIAEEGHVQSQLPSEESLENRATEKTLKAPNEEDDKIYFVALAGSKIDSVKNVPDNGRNFPRNERIKSNAAEVNVKVGHEPLAQASELDGTTTALKGRLPEVEITRRDEAPVQEIILSDKDARRLPKKRVHEKKEHRTSYLEIDDDERALPIGEASKIVADQIRKLISIRDDVLGTAGVADSPSLREEEEEAPVAISETTGNEERKTDEPKDADKSDQPIVADQEKHLDEKLRDSAEALEEELDKSPETPEKIDTQSSRKEESNTFIQRWKSQAMILQDQIRNRTFLQHLREQAIDVLPEMPSFTESQILETLKSLLSRKQISIDARDSYSTSMNASSLSPDQVEIIRCAESLVEAKQQQSFVSNMFDCIRGLSVLNCMRIFVWPVIADNIPASITDNFPTLPIEVNLADWIQGNRNRSKNARAESGVPLIEPLLAPESVIINILNEALAKNATYSDLPTIFDPTNATLINILTPPQVRILELGEKFLPESDRQEYTDRMFSCVRRFEYFSCVKYFEWPMVKRYFPGLPEFPDYQSWYPTIPVYPSFPLVPLPSFPDETGQLPEVIDADATRSRKPRPEEVILQILRRTLEQVPEAPSSPSFMNGNVSSLIAVIPPEQLVTVHTAEQLVPISFRPEFTSKTFKCIQEFNYLSCIKYSMWPAVRQFNPSLPQFPDFSAWIQELPDFFGYFPPLPGLQQFTEFFGISSGTVPVQPEQPTVLLRRYDAVPSSSRLFEVKIAKILTQVRDSMKSLPTTPSLVVDSDVFNLSSVTQEQLNVIQLAESIVPLSARTQLVTKMFECLRLRSNFANCTREVIWPCLGNHVTALPEFPIAEEKPEEEKTPTNMKLDSSTEASEKGDKLVEERSTLSFSEKLEEVVKGELPKRSDIKVDPNIRLNEVTPGRPIINQQTRPVISVTGTRFVPIFTELPEAVILNILRSTQASTSHTQSTVPSVRTPEFMAFLTEQQSNIVQLAESMIPEESRPEFVTKMFECIRENNFLVCSRDVIWPTLTGYFSRLPSFPNFGFLQASGSDQTKSPLHVTEQGSESVPNLETSTISKATLNGGQSGDATVTITDTRFVPIFTEIPETVVLNILRTIKASNPNPPASVSSIYLETRSPDVVNLLSEEQGTIIQTAESILPESARPPFVDKMLNCVRQDTFLDCNRNILWPTVAQFFPRLPNFPEYASLQSMAREKTLESSSGTSELNPDIPVNSVRVPSAKVVTDADSLSAEDLESRIESLLRESFTPDPNLPFQPSYLDVNSFPSNPLITTRQANIIKLAESILPGQIRPEFVITMLECIRGNNDFLSCSRYIGWPTVKQYIPSLPNFPEVKDLIPPLQDNLTQLPSTTGLSGLPVSEIPMPIRTPEREQNESNGETLTASATSNLSSAKAPNDIQRLSNAIKVGFSGLTIPQIPTALNQHFLPIKPGTSPIQIFISEAPTFPEAPEIIKVPGVPEFAGQPIKLVSDNSTNKPNDNDSPIETQRSEQSSRRRRSVVDLFESYRPLEADEEDVESNGHSFQTTFPNATESDFLRLLVNVSMSKKPQSGDSGGSRKEYFVDTLNATIKNSLTADQYEILKLVEDLTAETSPRGFLSRVVQCIRSLSFIRCMGIFVWPMISNNLPSLPSLPSIGAGFNPFGRSQEMEIQDFFGISSSEFETELLTRKKLIESGLLNWYKSLAQDKFETDLGPITVKGYGNGELGISLSEWRNGRAKKGLKDVKNVPSILAVITDFMEDILEQNEKRKTVKKDRSMEGKRTDDEEYQMLSDAVDVDDAARMVDDDNLVTMILEKIKTNASDYEAIDGKYFGMDDAYNAFEVLFGPKLTGRIADKLKTFHSEQRSEKSTEANADDLVDELEIVPLEGHMADDEDGSKMIRLGSRVAYDLEKDTAESKNLERRKGTIDDFIVHFGDQEGGGQFERNEKDAKGFLGKFAKNNFYEERQKLDVNEEEEREVHQELSLSIPKLNDDILARKTTASLISLGRGLKTKMTQMMPGIGYAVSFVMQLLLSHARAAASMAGMLSNMALGSAMFSMIRQTLFGPSTHPKIKYVYDNEQVGPGIAWPSYDHHGHY